MTAEPGFDVKHPTLDRTQAPHKGLPVRPYVYRGSQPWTPKKSR